MKSTFFHSLKSRLYVSFAFFLCVLTAFLLLAEARIEKWATNSLIEESRTLCRLAQEEVDFTVAASRAYLRSIAGVMISGKTSLIESLEGTGLKDILLLDAKGRVVNLIGSVGAEIGFDFSEHPFYKSFQLRKDNVSSEKMIDAHGGQYTISIGEKVAGHLVIATLDLNKIKSLLDVIAERMNGELLVIDRRGSAVSSSKKSELNREYDPHLFTLVERMRTLRTQMEIDAETHHHLAIPLKKMDASIVLTVKHAVIDQKLAYFQSRSKIFLLVFTLLFVLFAYVAYREVMRPFLALSNAFARWEKGEEDLDVSGKYYQEFSQIITTFNKTREIINLKLRENQEALKNLKDSEAFQKSILANFNHELRSPLHAIGGLIDMIREKANGSLPPSVKDDIEEIEKISDTMSVLIDNLIDINRLDHPRISEIQLHNFCWEDLSKEVGDFFKFSLMQKGLSWSVKFDQLDGKTLYCSDQSKIRQILVNLVGNAYKFTEKGKIELIFKPNTTKRPGNIHIQLRDTGIGISPDNLYLIFEKFYQVDQSYSRRYGGIGIGLYLVRELSKRLGGDAWVESSEGRGSCFNVTLKVGDEVISSQDHSKKLELQKKNPRVLVVDDAIDNRKIVRYYLESVGATVLEAENGAHAFEIVQREILDIVLMDIQMPVMDGLTSTRLIREWEKENTRDPLQIVALTAHVLYEDQLASIEAGCNIHLNKPIKRKLLLQALNII